MSLRGLMIRPIGRLFREASPERTDRKSWPANMPEISLVVVPLLPTFRVSPGALSPWRPLPWT